jgi:hypothetical protein
MIIRGTRKDIIFGIAILIKHNKILTLNSVI